MFNVGNDREEVTILELARRVKQRTGGRSAIELVPYDRAYEEGFEDMQRRVPDLAKLRALTGYEPKVGPRRDPGARDRLLHLRRHAAVKPAEYRRMFEAEERQWWYAGQREVALALLEPWARGSGALRLLDAGCGTGFNLVALAPLGPTLGIDLSPEAIRFCRERGVRARARLRAARCRSRPRPSTPSPRST